MSTEIVNREEPDLYAMAQIMAKSGFFTDSRDAAQAAVKIQAGRELGFPPVASMTGVYIVKGKVSLSANLIAAAIKRSKKYDYHVLSLDDSACELEFFEGSRSLGKSRFSIDDAKTAGLTGNQTYRSFPRNMCFSRAISNGAKWYCPDIFGGPIYTPDELGAAIDEETGCMVVVGDTAPALALPPATLQVVSDETGEVKPLDTPELAAPSKREIAAALTARGFGRTDSALAVSAYFKKLGIESFNHADDDAKLSMLVDINDGKLDHYKLTTGDQLSLNK